MATGSPVQSSIASSSMGEVLLLGAVCRLLGGISERTAARWINRPHDPLPAARPGGRRLLFLRSSVLDWLARQQMSAAAPRTVKRLRKRSGGSRGTVSATR